MVSSQAIIQVAAKGPLIDFTTEIMVSRGNQTYIYLDHLCPSDPLELAFLQDAQKHRLALRRQITDLIEKLRSPIRPLESAELASEGSGESPFLLSEQFTLDQIWIEGRTVDVHERLPSSATGIVYSATVIGSSASRMTS
jgi:hypothetical protein